ncbi:spinster family MFS transporter [Sphingopyxis sp.]|uniref:spinster family MFS transporter n=1 Tax=Sphingopyxis sp. TaxID=1908224 RepID=UPI0035B0E585
MDKVEQGNMVSSAKGRKLVWFMFLMFLVSTLNMADRQIIGIVAEPIKREFGISDTLLGLLGGTAFALVYPPLGLPIARLADRFNRRNILSFCLGFWSLATAACSLATGFWWLLLARIGVAGGEAGYAPCSHSLIADSVDEKRRATAFAILVTGISAGGFLASALGGYVAQHYGWRYAFLAIGLPGLLVALLLRFTLQEPERVAAPTGATAWHVYRRLLRNRAFSWCVSGSALHLVVTYGLGAWAVVWFVRGHDMSLAAAGLALGALGAIAGALGSVCGGLVGDRLALIDRRWLGWWPAITVLVAALVGAPAFLTRDVNFAIAGVTLAVFLNALYQPSTYALVQSVAAPSERASAAALMIFFQNLVGLGFGPVAIGIASDLMTPGLGKNALGLALAAVFLFNIGASIAYLQSARFLNDKGE